MKPWVGNDEGGASVVPCILLFYLVVKGYPPLCSVAVEGSDLPALPQSQFPREVDFACPLYPLLFILVWV